MPSATAILSVPTGAEVCSAERLLEFWAPTVLRWCRMLCGERCPAEDAAQEVLILLADRAPAVTVPAELKGWLWGVTWRTVRARRRSAWLRRWLPGSGPHAGDMDVHRAPEGASDTDHAVRAILDRLPEADRLLLWLAYAEGATREEIAVHLGLSIGTLNRRLTRSRQAFDRLAREHGLGGPS